MKRRRLLCAALSAAVASAIVLAPLPPCARAEIPLRPGVWAYPVRSERDTSK